MADIEYFQLRELEKINNNIKELNKTMLNMGRLMNDAILTIRKACQLLEDEAHNKTEVVQKIDSVDILVDDVTTNTIGVDFTQFRDIMTGSDIIMYFGNGKVHQVLRQELDGTREDITEQWLKDHPQED